MWTNVVDKCSEQIIENFTLYWNSKEDTNSISILDTSAELSKKLLEFRFGKFSMVNGEFLHGDADVQGEIEHSCTVCIDGIKIVTQLGKSKKIAKQHCADAAYTILKERQPSVDISVSISTVGQKRQSSDVAVGSKEMAKNPTFFIKENTSVEKVCCPSGQDQLSPPTTNLYPEIPKENLGHQLLKRMGWNGGGLGREGNEGRVEPIMHGMIRRRQGLGVELRKQPGWKQSAVTTNNPVSNFVQPSSATTIRPVCNVQSSMTATIQPFAAIPSKSVNIIQLSSATMKPLCSIMPSATTTIQPAYKTSQSVIDVDMLFQPTSTNLASNGAAPHSPLMSNKLVFKPKTTVSPVPSKPVASNVKVSLPIPSNSVRNMATSTQSVRNGMSGASKSVINKQLSHVTSKPVDVIDVDMVTVSGASKSVIDKQLSHITSKPVDVIDVDMVTAPTNAIRNAKIGTSVKSSLLNTVLKFLKSSQKELRLSDLLTKESRISLFRLCDARGLQFQSFIKAKKRRIIISKPED